MTYALHIINAQVSFKDVHFDGLESFGGALLDSCTVSSFFSFAYLSSFLAFSLKKRSYKQPQFLLKITILSLDPPSYL